MITQTLTSIPEELKQMDCWLCWKLTERDGKHSKVPCAPETGYPIDPSIKLYSYSEACQYLETYPGNVTGIGFYFTGGGISGIDLDKCIDDAGILSSDARQIIKKLDSYTEYSPSGKGLHIIFRGSLPPGSRNRKGNYEVYSSKRYFTVTGNVFEDKASVESCQTELEWFLGKYIQPKHIGRADDIEALIKNSKNGNKFERLMQGDISDYKNDNSRADAALMSILAFYCRKDRSLIEEMFNRSELANRDKWKTRPDYRDRTIKYAIDNTKEVYAGQENSQKLVTNDEQRTAANSVLERFENPCGSFDTALLPEKLRRYVDHICNTTDADPMIVTTSVIGMISGVLKKSVYIPEVDASKAPNECYFERLYPNVYFLNVLQSGSFKSTALNKGFKIAYQLEKKSRLNSHVQQSENGMNRSGELDFLEGQTSLPQNIFLPQKSTVEALLSDLTDLDGGVIVLSEFGSWLQEMEKSYNLGLKSMFTNFYDVPRSYGVSTRRDGRTILERPYISIVGVSTIDWVKDNINVKDVSTGFFARFLIFNPPVKPKTPSAMPVRRHAVDKEIENELLDIFLQKVPQSPREYSLTMEAYNRFEGIHNSLYQSFNKLPVHTQAVIEPYIKRWSPYILKIGMIFQFMSDPDSTEISVDAINSAYEIVKYAIKSTTYMFNRDLVESKHDTNCRKVLEYIASRTKGGKTTTWGNILQSHILPGGGRDYERVISDLLESTPLCKQPGSKKKDDIYYLATGR